MAGRSPTFSSRSACSSRSKPGSTPLEGWIVDCLGAQRGPKLMIAFGGVTVAIAWIINANADTLTALYIGSALVGHRRRRRLCDLRRQCGQVVPRPARPRRRSDRCGFRRGRRPHRHSDPRSDRHLWLSVGVLLVRPRPGRDRFRGGVADAGAAAGETPSTEKVKVAQTSHSFTPGADARQRRCSGCST